MQILYAGKTDRWANSETTLHLVTSVIVPYINAVRERMELTDHHPAIVLYDAFRGHQSPELQKLLADNHILSVKVPNNCTDRLQPLDVSVNKAVKDHLHKSFNTWYAEQVQQQLAQGKAIEEVKVDLRMSVMKPLETKWIVSCYDYLRGNKQIGFNGFKESGIVDALQNAPPTTTAPTEDDPFEGLSDED